MSTPNALAAGNQMDVISLMGTPTQTQLMLPKVPTTNGDHVPTKPANEPPNDGSQPLMIDFNDPSTTNFLLSALASGASSDSNAIVNHLFQKAQTQQQQQQQTVTAPPPVASLPPAISTASIIRKKLPIIASGSKNCTETTNLLPARQSVVLHVPSTNEYNPQASAQQIIINNGHTEERKPQQQIFFINNKPYIIQQKVTRDASAQQRLILTPTVPQVNGTYCRCGSGQSVTSLVCFQNHLQRIAILFRCTRATSTSAPFPVNPHSTTPATVSY